ncbi:MAG: hypothetical protein ACXWP4_12085 [Polyangiales bacterium]
MRLVVWTLLFVGCSSNDAQPPADTAFAADTVAVETTASDTTASDSFEASAPERIYGVTVDDIAPLASIVESLSKLPQKPTARIVFDEGQPPSYYGEATTQIGAVAFVMGEMLDSQFVKDISVDEYGQRAKEYLDALGGKVDIWEIGNEINGEWLGTSADVAAKAKSAFDLAKSRGYKTALTLYWNASCYSDADHEMFTWTSANVPEAMKSGLDYVLVSYYDDDCPGEKPDWPAVFSKLAAIFPTAKLGIGECGTERAEAKSEFIHRYYGLSVPEPRFVGGQFWWYFVNDMVPSSKPLWSELAAAMK